jgi:hypothetical protein
MGSRPARAACEQHKRSDCRLTVENRKALGHATLGGECEPQDDRQSEPVSFAPIAQDPAPKRTGPDELAETFFAHSRRLDDRERARLYDLGITNEAIEADFGRASGPLRSALVVCAGPYFDFAPDEDDDAVQAFVVIARDTSGTTSDIVAFNLAGRLARYLARAPMLGEHLVLAPRLDLPLRVFETVAEWLCGGRDGVVLLDDRLAARLLEGHSLQVGADEVAFGTKLKARLTLAPTIVVGDG